MRFRLALLAATTAVALVAATPADRLGRAGTDRRPAPPGAGDPYFPLQGNGGYDVRDYGLDLRYDPATRRLDGTAAILRDGDPGAEPVRPRPARVHGPLGHA